MPSVLGHRVKYRLDHWTLGLFFGLFFGPFLGLNFGLFFKGWVGWFFQGGGLSYVLP